MLCFASTSKPFHNNDTSPTSTFAFLAVSWNIKCWSHLFFVVLPEHTLSTNAQAFSTATHTHRVILGMTSPPGSYGAIRRRHALLLLCLLLLAVSTLASTVAPSFAHHDAPVVEDQDTSLERRQMLGLPWGVFNHLAVVQDDPAMPGAPPMNPQMPGVPAQPMNPQMAGGPMNPQMPGEAVPNGPPLPGGAPTDPRPLPVEPQPVPPTLPPAPLPETLQPPEAPQVPQTAQPLPLTEQPPAEHVPNTILLSQDGQVPDLPPASLPTGPGDVEIPSPPPNLPITDQMPPQTLPSGTPQDLTSWAVDVSLLPTTDPAGLPLPTSIADISPTRISEIVQSISDHASVLPTDPQQATNFPSGVIDTVCSTIEVQGDTVITRVIPCPQASDLATQIPGPGSLPATNGVPVPTAIPDNGQSLSTLWPTGSALLSSLLTGPGGNAPSDVPIPSALPTDQVTAPVSASGVASLPSNQNSPAPATNLPATIISDGGEITLWSTGTAQQSPPVNPSIPSPQQTRDGPQADPSSQPGPPNSQQGPGPAQPGDGPGSPGGSQSTPQAPPTDPVPNAPSAPAGQQPNSQVPSPQQGGPEASSQPDRPNNAPPAPNPDQPNTGTASQGDTSPASPQNPGSSQPGDAQPTRAGTQAIPRQEPAAEPGTGTTPQGGTNNACPPCPANSCPGVSTSTPVPDPRQGPCPGRGYSCAECLNGWFCPPRETPMQKAPCGYGWPCYHCPGGWYCAPGPTPAASVCPPNGSGGDEPVKTVTITATSISVCNGSNCPPGTTPGSPSNNGNGPCPGPNCPPGGPGSNGNGVCTGPNCPPGPSPSGPGSGNGCTGPNCPRPPTPSIPGGDGSGCPGPNCPPGSSNNDPNDPDGKGSASCTGPDCPPDATPSGPGACTGPNCPPRPAPSGPGGPGNGVCPGPNCPPGGPGCVGPNCAPSPSVCTGPHCPPNGSTCTGPNCPPGSTPGGPGCVGPNCPSDGSTCTGPNCPPGSTPGGPGCVGPGCPPQTYGGSSSGDTGDGLKVRAAPVVGGWKYLGCLSDSARRTLDCDPADRYVGNMSNAKCVEHCSKKGYKLAGTEWSRECFCGNVFRNARRLPEEQCDSPCDGDSKDACGGDWALTVYSKDGTGVNTVLLDGESDSPVIQAGGKRARDAAGAGADPEADGQGWSTKPSSPSFVTFDRPREAGPTGSSQPVTYLTAAPAPAPTTQTDDGGNIFSAIQSIIKAIPSELGFGDEWADAPTETGRPEVETRDESGRRHDKQDSSHGLRRRRGDEQRASWNRTDEPLRWSKPWQA